MVVSNRRSNGWILGLKIARAKKVERESYGIRKECGGVLYIE